MSTAWNFHAIEQTQPRRKYRVDGVEFDFHIGTAASDAFDGCPRGAGTVNGGSIAGDASASLGFTPDNGGECAIEERCAVLVGNDWVVEKETWGKGESWEVTDRWKTGDITWYGDYIDDKSCGTGKYGLPEKEVDENDSGELSGNQPVRRVHPTILHEVLSRRLRGRAGSVEG